MGCSCGVQILARRFYERGIKMPRFYTAQDYIKSDMTLGELRRAYGGSAATARRKLQNLERVYGSQAQIVREHAGDFKKLSELGNLTRQELAMELARVSRFHRSDSGTVKGYARARTELIEKLRENGFDFVNNKNLDAVQQYLDFMRDTKLSRQYGSVWIIDALMDTYGEDKTVDALSRAVNTQGMTPQQLAANIERWLDNIEAVKAGRKAGRLVVRSGKGRNN